VFLDDDATFEAEDAAERIRVAFAADEHPVALAFGVRRSSGLTMSSEYPFRGSAIDATRRPCGYFVGCGVAVRRADYLRVGGFDDRYWYSTEEIDLSFALQRDGSTIMYEPDIVVVHAPSERGRSSRGQVAAFHLRNRLLLVRRHLPWPVACIHALAWAGRTFVEAVRTRGVLEWLRAWMPGLRWPVERRPVGLPRLREISARGGRVWW
jgi:GT2 family glycosyltransferase